MSLPNILEYDLNVFYPEEQETMAGYVEDLLYIQPSAYKVDDFISDRQYLDGFALTLEETRAIAPDFPIEEYGSDFFIAMDVFMSRCKALPDTVAKKLAMLPPIESIKFGGPQIQWLPQDS